MHFLKNWCDIISLQKLKTDPLQVKERELFVQFFTSPDQMRRSVEDIMARVQSQLVK